MIIDQVSEPSKTCKTLQYNTKQRIIWIDALHRICFDNTLFLPSFPIFDMSNEELEQAAMAPYRWIKLCTATFAKNQSNGSRTELQPTIARIIQEPFDEARIGIKTFLVPGGRYLVAYSLRRIGIWDLGHTQNADCKLIGSAKWDQDFHTCMVNTTSDGMGLIILAFKYAHTVIWQCLTCLLMSQKL